MGLSGNFKDTSFADLLQFYSASKQTVAVTVRLGAPDRVDGTFYFADGDLVGAKLADAEGREAVRRALKLREGAFTVDMGQRPAVATLRDSLRKILLEDVGTTAEVPRPAAARPAGAPAAGAAPSPGGPPVVKRSPTSAGVPPAPGQPGASRPPQAARPATQPGTPAAAPRTSTSSTAIPKPPPADAARRAPTPAAVPAPAFQTPEKGGPGKIIAVALALVAILGIGAWLVFGERSAPPVAAPKARVTTRGVLDESLVLGMVASFTGSNKERGKAMKVGWDTAIGEVNDAGGIHGRKLKLLTFDDGYDPARTAPAMKEAVEVQGAFAIVGNVGTATAAVAAPYAGEHDAIFFGPLSGADLLRKTPPDRHVFNFRASLATEAASAVRYLVEVRRIDAKRIATLEQDDDFGASGRRGAVKQLGTYGVAEASILKLTYPRNTADVRDAIAKLKERAADVDAVVMTATYKPAATFIRRAKDSGLKLFFTTVSADSTGLSEELVLSGKGYTEDVLLTQVVPVPTSPATTLIRYRKALEKYAPGEAPGSTSLEAWIGAQIFIEGLRRAGRELDSAKLIASLESIQKLDLGIGGVITFGKDDHQGCDVVWGWLLQPDGTYKQVALE